MTKRILYALTVLWLAFFTPQSATVLAQEPVMLNFVNADIHEVIRLISQISKKNFLVDPRVKGTINVVSGTPVPPALAYDILLSALRLQGYAAVETKGVTKIVPETDAKLHVDALSQGRAGDRLITRVFILKYESASQLVNVVRPMISPNNVVVAYPASNALVVTDYASNIRRIEKVIELFDRPADDGPIFIPVRHASALDLVDNIKRLMPESTMSSQGGDGNQRLVLLADSRTNTLILRSENPGHIARVNELVSKLDVPTEAPGNIHVVPLKNSDATQLAQTLRAALNGETAPPSPPQTANASRQPTSSSQPPAMTPLTVQADLATNSLIIVAPEPVYNNVRAIIEKLDVRRPQFFVEALIVEVTADKAAEFGVQWQHLSSFNSHGTHIIGGTNFGTTGNITGAAKDITTVGQGLNIGLIRGSTTLLDGTKILNLGMLAHALENDSRANILSMPNLMTLDNEEARIVVGQNVPFITGQYAQTGSAMTATPFQTIERKDVGLTLKIKPQILQGGTVKLHIYQEVSNVASTTASTAGIITNKRSIESSILVEEGEIAVLGGLIQDSVSDVTNKIPLLGDIPLLGQLFRNESRQHVKTNLMVFIRPKVLYQADHHLASVHYEQIEKQRKDARLPDHWILPDDDRDKSIPDKPSQSTADSPIASSALLERKEDLSKPLP